MNPENSADSSHKQHTIREWINTIIVAILIALPIRYFIASPFIVRGASMDPTFASGQFLIVDRLSYRLENPQRNDVIVFKYPNNPSLYYIKRIIGLPNETIKISDGNITIVNSEFPEGFNLDQSYILADHQSEDNMKVILGPDEYFVMGDNRAQSADSRSWGALGKGYITGKPIVRLFPISAIEVWPGEVSDK